MAREFQGLEIRGLAAPPQVVIIDNTPYIVVIRPLLGIQGQGVNVVVGIAPIPEMPVEDAATKWSLVNTEAGQP